MFNLAFTYTTTVEFSESIHSHTFVLRCLPADTSVQIVRAHLDLEPDVPYDLQKDSFGNNIAVGTIEPKHQMFRYVVEGKAMVDRSRIAKVPAHPMFRYATPRTAIDDDMRNFLADAVSAGARQAVLTGTARLDSPTFTCVNLMHAVYEAMEYKPGSTAVDTTAAQAFAQKEGVCQDFSHILIGLLRACGYPARYVSGLTVGEGATHAWVEAHIDGHWMGFDPTRNKLVDDTYLSLGVGRDWGDCPIERGTFQGFVDQTQTVFTQVEIV